MSVPPALQEFVLKSAAETILGFWLIDLSVWKARWVDAQGRVTSRHRRALKVLEPAFDITRPSRGLNVYQQALLEIRRPEVASLPLVLIPRRFQHMRTFKSGNIYTNFRLENPKAKGVPPQCALEHSLPAPPGLIQISRTKIFFRNGYRSWFRPE